MGTRVRLAVSVIVISVMMCLMAAPAFATGDGVCPPPEPPPCGCAGTATPGYWKNHPEAWPVESITLGGVTYTKEAAIERLGMPDGDKRQTIFRALLAAKLNVLNGCDSSEIMGTIGTADSWLMNATSRVAGSSPQWMCGEPLYLCLDAYNNGLLNVPPRD